jgi:hypothetical protein
MPSLLGAACVAGTVPLHRVLEGATRPSGLSGTWPLLGSPALKRLPPPEVGAGLGDLEDRDGEDVLVVVAVGKPSWGWWFVAPRPSVALPTPRARRRL